MWVALLRGINVGRAKRVAMADLRTLLESLGYDDVRTHGQSGNVVFATDARAADVLEGAIAARLEDDLGIEAKVLVRSAEEFAAVVDANPFPARGVDPKELHFSFLSAPLPAKQLASLDRAEFAPDEFEPGERVIYTRLPNGVRASRLPDWERLLGVTVTARNWNTVTHLRDLATQR